MTYGGSARAQYVVSGLRRADPGGVCGAVAGSRPEAAPPAPSRRPRHRGRRTPLVAGRQRHRDRPPRSDRRGARGHRRRPRPPRRHPRRPLRARDVHHRAGPPDLPGRGHPHGPGHGVRRLRPRGRHGQRGPRPGDPAPDRGPTSTCCRCRSGTTTRPPTTSGPTPRSARPSVRSPTPAPCSSRRPATTRRPGGCSPPLWILGPTTSRSTSWPSAPGTPTGRSPCSATTATGSTATSWARRCSAPCR